MASWLARMAPLPDGPRGREKCVVPFAAFTALRPAGDNLRFGSTRTPGMGWTVSVCSGAGLSIIADEGVRTGTTGFRGGFCGTGTTAVAPVPVAPPPLTDGDLRRAANACMTPGASRAAIPLVRRRQGCSLTESARALVEQHWR